jgi:hypothetical protein
VAVLSKDQEQAIKRYLKNPNNYIEYDGVRIVDNTEFSKFVAKLFNLPDDVSDKPGMNKVGYLKKQNAELFDGYELRKGNIFKRDKPLIQALKNDPVFRDEVNKKLKALKKKDFFDLTKDQQNTIVGTTEKIKKDLKILPKNYITKPELAERLKISEAAIEAYGLGKHGEIGEKYREIFKPVVLKNRGTFYDSTNIDKKIKKFSEFTDRPMLMQTTKDRANLFASNDEIQDLLNTKNKTLFTTEEGLDKALKVLGKGSTPHEASHAMGILARAYNGEKFRGVNVKPNKAKAKFIFKNISDLQMDNPWTNSLYDEGLRQVDRELGNKLNTFKKFKKDYTYKMNQILKDLKIKDKFSINEVTSIKGSYNNKIAPYATFVDLTQADINKKHLRHFQGDLSRALAYLDDNKNNQAKVLDKIERFNTITRGKKLNLLKEKFGEAGKDVKLAEIIPGTNVESVYAKGDLEKWKQKGLDLQKLADEKGYFLDVKGARPYFEATEEKLKTTLINLANKLPDQKQVLVCNFLSNGGLPGDCKRAISQDTEKAAQIISKIPADTKETAAVKDSAQKLIRLYRGEGFNLRTGPSIKEMAKTFGVSEAEAKKKLLSGQWFTSDPVASASYTDKLGKTKYVDVTPKEFMDFKRYVDRVNKTKSLSGSERYPVNKGDKISIIPRYKLKEFEEAGKLKSERNIFKDFTTKSGYMERAEGVLSYDSVKGGFVDPADPTTVVNQDQIKAWAEANPEKVTAGTEAVEAATNKSVLSNVAKSLARVGAPLPVAAIDSYFIGKQVAEGKGTAEIASNPLNWLGLATMEPLAKASGIAQPGKLNAILRLGLNPATIRGITRFAGLPGLAVSTAMTAYDQYQKYKDGEGFIFNLLNQKGTE